MDLLTFSDSVIFNPRCRESGTVLSKLLKLGHNKNYNGTFPSCMATWPSMQNAINSTHALKIKQTKRTFDNVLFRFQFFVYVNT